MSHRQEKDILKKGQQNKTQGEITPNTRSEIDNSNTSFADKLTELRQKIVESGQPLLTWDEINEEVGRRRGGNK